jgi:DNA-binding FadR family transcriptional regulator
MPLRKQICPKTVGYGCRVAQQQSDRFASRRLANALRAGIISGARAPGSRMPSYRQLRDVHGIALNTAQAAIRLLAVEGLVEIRPARGAYVRDSSHEGDNRTLDAELTHLRAMLRRSRDDLEAAEGLVAELLSQLPSQEPGQ